MIPAEQDFINAIRAVTRELGAVLILDEVITLRLAPGGGQEWYGVEGDLSCYGKMLGGGLPLGALGGRADLMALFDPAGNEPLAHPGSMNGYPVALAAAMATLDALTPSTIASMNAAGDELRSRLESVAVSHARDVCVTGAGSLLGLHMTTGPVRSFRDTWVEDTATGHALFLGLLNEGVLIDRRGAACLSSVSTASDVDAFVDAFDTVLERLG